MKSLERQNKIFKRLKSYLNSADENNEFNQSTIPDIWGNSYVQQLGIIDHCREIVTIYDEWKVIKSLKDEGYDSLVTKTYQGLENEMMDLFVILEKWSEGKKELKNKRLDKFKEKAESSSEIKITEYYLNLIQKEFNEYLDNNLNTIRKGQAMYDIACNYFPMECNKLKNSEFDCYYDDSKAYIFLEKLKELVDYK